MTSECRKPWAQASASACSRALKYAVSLALFAACVNVAGADDKTNYERRAAARYVALFQSLDRNNDGRVTLLEAHGDLNFGPRFDDMDINRDGVVTLQELQRYVGQQYGIQIDRASR